MFVQIIRGQVADEREALAAVQAWLDEIRPDAVGWVGTTAGVSDAGELFLQARFTSEEEAQRNGDRPKQSAWWEEMEACFSGPITFHNCRDVATMLDGGDEECRFVQIMEWAGAGSHSAQELAEMGEQMVREHRPDVHGSLICVADDGTTLETVYFSSEEEARRAEAQEMPPEVAEEFRRMMEEMGEPSYHDLHTPVMALPAMSR